MWCGPPGNFDASGATRYPVVYFLHGMGGTESADAGGFSSLAARGIREGRLGPVIRVFPNGGRSGCCGSVETMIVDELIPLIDRTYPTKGTGSSRLLAGFSMGGAGAVRLAIHYPALFGAAASWGGGMGFGPNAAELRNALLEAFHRNADGCLRIHAGKRRPGPARSL